TKPSARSRPASPEVTSPPGTRLTAEQIAQIHRLTSSQSQTRERSAEQIVADPQPAALSALSMMLALKPDCFATSQYLWVLRRIGTPLATDIIGYTLQHPDPQIRAMCVRLLRSLNGPDLEKRTLALSTDADPEVRVEAALCRKESKDVVTDLFAALRAGANED